MLKMAMARKTKKEKILAQYHRKLKLLETAMPKTVTPRGVKTEVTLPIGSLKYSLSNLSSEIPVASTQSKALTTTNYSYVISDLVRILFLTALAICAQLVLWYKYR